MVMDRRLLCAAAWTAASILFIAPNAAQAATSELIVSEIGWAGSSKSESDEWIELTNVSSAPIALKDWTLTGALASNAILTFPDATLLPGQTYLIANYAANDPKSVLTRAPDLVTSAVSLSNSALGLILKRSDGSVADQAGNGKTPLAGHTGTPTAAMVRVAPIVDGTVKSSWTDANAGTTDLGTPGFTETWFIPTPVPILDPVPPPVVEPLPPVIDPVPTDPVPTVVINQPVTTPDAPVSTPPTVVEQPTLTVYPPGTLVVSELMPAPPKDGQEWAEIRNPFNNVIPLRGWTMKNARGTSVPLPDQLLGLDQYVAVPAPSGFLANASGKLLLLDPNGSVIDWMAYGTGDVPAPKQAEALALDENGAWKITTTPTPGAANAITPRKPPAPAVTPAVPVTMSATDAAIALADAPPTPNPPPTATAPADFAISELYPNTGNDLQDEFVEVRNAGQTLADFKGWILRDRNRTMFTQRASLVLAPGEAVALPRPVTHLSLANAGDAIELIRPDQTVAEQIAYDATKRGQAYALVDGAWTWTVPTPDEANIPPSAAPDPTAVAPSTKSKPPPVVKKPKAVRAATKTVAATPAQFSGIITGRSGLRVKVESNGQTQTVVLPTGSDAGALGIKSGRTLEATGLRTRKNGAAILTVRSPNDVHTFVPAPPAPATPPDAPPATLGSRVTDLFSTAGTALRQLFGQT